MREALNGHEAVEGGGSLFPRGGNVLEEFGGRKS